MARIYQADLWCNDCGRAIEERLRAEGRAPEDVLDESSYDSNDFPKWASDDEESDTPQHCAAGPDCLSPTIIGWVSVGRFLGNALTADGDAYVREALREVQDLPLWHERRAIPDFWASWYGVACPCCHKVDEPGDCTCEREV